MHLVSAVFIHESYLRITARGALTLGFLVKDVGLGKKSDPGAGPGCEGQGPGPKTLNLIFPSSE